MKKFLIILICSSIVISIAKIAKGESVTTDDTDIRAAVDKLKKAYSTEVIMGKPIQVNELKIIPLATIGIGLGWQGKQLDSNNMQGVGSIVIPVGVIVVSNKGIRILQLSKGIFEQFISALAPVVLQIMNSGRKEEIKEGEIKGVRREQGRAGITKILVSVHSWITGLFLLGWIILALVIEMLLPKQVTEIASKLRRNYVRTSLIGMLCCGVSFFLAAIFALSLIGIPLAFVTIILICALTLFGTVGVALIVGQNSAAAFGRTRYSDVVFVLIGGVVLSIVGIVPVLGWLIWTIVGILGLGLVLQAQWENMRKNKEEI